MSTFLDPAVGRDAWFLIEDRCRAGVFCWNLSTDEVSWSRGLYRILGYDDGEIAPRVETMRSVIHPADRLDPAEMEARIARAFPFNRDLRIIRRDGRLRWLNVQYEFLHDERGSAKKMVGIATDITEQHGRNTVQRREADRFKEIVLGVAPIVWVVGPDGAVRETKGWCRVTGYADKTALGMGWVDCVHHDDRRATRAALMRALADESVFDWPFRLAQAGGGYHWFQPHAVPKLAADGSIEEWAGLLVDVDAHYPSQAAMTSEITGTQIRAARAILNWSVAQLSVESGLTSAVIRRLEGHDGIPPRSSAALRAVQAAAERAGIEFLFGPGGQLPGVRPADRPGATRI